MINLKNKEEVCYFQTLKTVKRLLAKRKAEETLEFKMIKPGETFHFNPPFKQKEIG